MMNGPMNSMLEPRRPAWSRPEAVFIVAALALLGAFLVPMSPAVLAVLWVCTFCLAGAVTIICVAAGSSSDLIGFVPLVSGLTLLRLAALAGSARRIIQQEPADPLLQATGGFLANQWPLGAVLICLLMAVIVSAVVFAASQKIALASTGYIHRILPLKRVGLETDVRMGVIDEAQAQTLARRLVSEFRFFAGMQGAGILLRGETAIIVVVLLACVLLPALGGKAQSVSGADFMAQHVPPVVGLAVFTLIPLVISAAACGGMMGRDTLALRSKPESPESPPAKKISIIAKETGAEEEIELLNPDSITTADAETQFADFEPVTTEAVSHEAGDGQPHTFLEALELMENEKQTAATEPAVTEPAEGPVEEPAAVEPVLETAGAPAQAAETDEPAQAAARRETTTPAEPAAVKSDKEELTCRNAEAYYDKLSRTILAKETGCQQVLLAADTPADLPVTVAVNVAIRLAQRHKKVLLVDTDTARHALARVFDMDPQTLLKKAMPTCFEKLSVCNVPAEKLQKLMQKTEILRHFDVTLMYAPNSSGLAIAPAATLSGFYFSAGDTSPAGRPAICDSLETIAPVHSVIGHH